MILNPHTGEVMESRDDLLVVLTEIQRLEQEQRDAARRVDQNTDDLKQAKKELERATTNLRIYITDTQPATRSSATLQFRAQA